MPGARCTRSLVCSVLVAHECSHHGRTGITRHSRTRMVLTAYFVVSPVIGLSCHRRQRIKGFAGPGRARKTSADLTPASRRQDHTTSPSASASFVSALRGMLTGKPALLLNRAPDAAASTASRSYVRDDRETPLSVRPGWRER